MLRLGKIPAVRDAVDLLLDCHQRIRSFVGLARRVAAADLVDEEPLREAAVALRRYFSEALPLHARDEEESVLPRLRGIDATLDAELDRMAREHAEHQGSVAALVEACSDLIAQPSRQLEIAAGLAATAEELEQHFAVHLRREEEVIFPAMRRLLDPAADLEIVREIRARRAPAADRGVFPQGR